MTETLLAYKMDPAGGRLASDVAGLYAQSVEGRATGTVLEFPRQ